MKKVVDKGLEACYYNLAVARKAAGTDHDN